MRGNGRDGLREAYLLLSEFSFFGTLRNIEKSREIKLVLLFSLGFFDYFCRLIKNASNTKANSLYDVFF